MKTALPSIVRVLSVVDTREFELVGSDNGRDRWQAILGSGQVRQCDRCKRDHEIHATVELSDGTQSIVGVSCARGESMDVQGALRSGAASATTTKKIQAQLARARVELASYKAARAEVEALQIPEFVDVPGLLPGSQMRVSLGDAMYWGHTVATLDEETRVYLIADWRRNRMNERGFKSWHSPEWKVTGLETRLARRTVTA